MAILGPDGRPITSSILGQEIATTTAYGIRRPWYPAVSTGMDPKRLASILKGAVDGYATDFYTLAEEMEEREPHYASVLATAKLSISGIPATVEAPTDSAQDTTLADAVRTHIVSTPYFRPLLHDLLDALGKGFSAVEINWNTKEKPWKPAKGISDAGKAVQPYAWRDQRFFQWDRQTGHELRLLDEKDRTNGLPLPPYKFIIHVNRMKAGLPARGGLARLAAISYMAKIFALEDWLAFAEVFGMPMRIGKYSPAAKKEDIKTLITAVANLGTDAAAVIPESMEIEFQAAVTGEGSQIFRSLAEWTDAQISKAVLGHTGAADSIPGRLGGESEANEIRDDRKTAIAQQLEATLQEQLVEPFIRLNFGEQVAYPQLRLRVEEPEDLATLAVALEKLVPMGLKVEQSVIRDKFGLPEPDAGAELLAVAGALPPTIQAQNRARNRAERSADSLLTDLEDEALADWKRLEQPIADIGKLGADSSDYSEFMQKLSDFLKTMSPEKLIVLLAKTDLTARGIGDAIDAET